MTDAIHLGGGQAIRIGSVARAPWVLGLSFAILLVSGQTSRAQMRYHLDVDQVLAYQVTIVAETSAEKDTMSGIIAFTGKAVEDDGLTMQFRGGLTRKKQAKGSAARGRGPRGFGRRPGGPPIPRSPMSRFRTGVSFDGLTQSTSELVIGRRGGVKRMSGQSQLPYLLGNLAVLPFEPLPREEKTSWESDSGISITQGSSDRFPRGPFRGRGQETTTGGSESAQYRVQQREGQRVTIQKTYRLFSPPATKDDDTMEIQGNGTLVYNAELRVPESLDFKQKLTVKDNNSTVTIPMTIAWHRISQQEFETHLKKREEQIAALRQRAQQRKSQGGSAPAKPLDASKKMQILAELKSDTSARVVAQLTRLQSHTPHPSDADIGLLIRDLQDHTSRAVSSRATQLWKKWSAIVDQASGTQTAAITPAAADNPFATADEVDGARQLRTWTDLSGTFKVEAAFQRMEGDAVVLKRKDGKEIRVPVGRLSTSDQELVNGLRD